MLIAIDHGNYAIKTTHTAFLSGLTESKVKPPLSEEVLEYAGSFWTLSGKRVPYMRDKTQDDRYFVLTLFRHCPGTGVPESLGALCPGRSGGGPAPEHYGMLREKFSQYFQRGVVKFSYQDRSLTLEIRRVLVYPQA